jgi:glycosyltransferase involved in cell wall biosynthesis
MADAGAKRVLFVAYYFPPRGGVSVQRSLKFVKYLRRFGWEPTVLTIDHERRSGIYDETLTSEIPEGTRVVRVPSHEKFFVDLAGWGLGRLAGLVFRPDAQVTWVRRALARAMELHAEKPFDVVYTSVQPWSAGLVGMKFKERTGVPWVSDFRDPWTRSLSLVWPTKHHWRHDLALEGKYLQAADRTLAVTPTIRDGFLEDHRSVSGEKIVVLHNGYDAEDLDGEAAGDDGKFTVVFTGRFQADYGRPAHAGAWETLRSVGTYYRKGVWPTTHSPEYFLKGLADFLSRTPAARGKVRVVFAGAVSEGNKRLAPELGLEDIVECPGFLPHAKAVSLMKSADALFLPMWTTVNASERVPYASGKVFEYIAARRPILALVPEGDAKDIAVGSGLGVTAPPRDVAAISTAIGRLYDAWAAGAPLVTSNEEFIRAFTRENLTRELAAVFDGVIGGTGGRS